MFERISNAPSIEREGYEATIQVMRRRLARLQAAFDSTADALLERIGTAESTPEAWSLGQTYNRAWFRSSLFSPEVKVKIAAALIAAVRHYPIVDTTAWAKIVSEGSE